MAAPMATANQPKIRTKGTKKKPSYKNVLVDPFKVSWPVIEAEVESDILDKMKSTFSACNLGRQPNVKVHIASLNKKDRRKGKQERKEELKRKREERHKTESDQGRSQPLILGINNVMRCLEKDQLRLVAVCRNVHHSLLAMTNHLIPLCASRGCPSVCLPNLQTQLTSVLSVSSLLALGIKKPTKEDSNSAAMDELVSYISERCRPLEISWLERDTAIGSNTLSDAECEAVAEMSAETLSLSKSGINYGMEAKNISCEPDFSDLYIKKRVSKDGGLENRGSGFGDLDFIQFGNPSVESSDEDGEVVSYTLLASSKTKEVNPNRCDVCVGARGDGSEVHSEKASSIGKRKLSHNDVEVAIPSKFRKARIRQKVPNPNKKKKRQKPNS